MTEQYYVECECHHDTHRVVFSYHPGEPDDPELYITYFLDAPSFLGRLKLAIKYLFGYKCIYGHFGCTLIDKPSAHKIQNILAKYIQEST